MERPGVKSMLKTRRTYPPVSKKTKAKPFHKAGAISAATLIAKDTVHAMLLDKVGEPVTDVVLRGGSVIIIVCVASGCN